MRLILKVFHAFKLTFVANIGDTFDIIIPRFVTKFYGIIGLTPFICMNFSRIRLV